MQVLVCANGSHEWVKNGRGRPPKNCPEHRSPAEMQAATRHRTFYAPHPRERKQPDPKVQRTAAERSQSASRAARARWAKFDPSARSERMREVARARFGADMGTRVVAVVEIVACPYCGTEMRGGKRRQCGADACRRQFNVDRGAAYRAMRRAKTRGALVEKFHPDEVFVRDAWVCGICELPVDRSLRWPEPGSPSLDHVVPLASGGSHTRENTQCSHLYCNSVKGARLTA